MQYIGYLISGFIVFWLVEFLAINVGGAIGSGAGEAGIVVSAVAILCAIVVICTMVIVDAITLKTAGGKPR